MLQAILNKSWKQYPIKHQLHDHLRLISNTIQLDEQDIRDTAG